MFRTTMAATLLFGLPAQALEADCNTWVAFDFGDGAYAKACNQAPEAGAASILLRCGSGGDLSLHYVVEFFGHSSSGDFDWQGTARFTSGDMTVQAESTLNLHDGAFEVEVPRDGELLALLRAGVDLSVSLSRPDVRARSFTLAGADFAIGAVVATCR